MAYPLALWLAVQDELVVENNDDKEAKEPEYWCASGCFDDFQDEELEQTFHLNRACLAFIRDTVHARMRKHVSKRPAPSVDVMLQVTLSYYAQGFVTVTLLHRAGLGASENATTIINTVSGVIAGMSDQFISFPTSPDAKASMAAKLEGMFGIPGVLGVLAPAHFKIRASPYERDVYRSFLNSLGFTSVVSQLICDYDGNVLSVEKCCKGGTCEQEMWKTSFKGREMEEDGHGPYWLIGGNGYNQSKHVLTPVTEPANDRETRFNEAHAKVLSIAHRTLKDLKRRFKCLAQLGFALDGSLDKKCNVIKSCCVLHNIAKKFSVPPPPLTSKEPTCHLAARPRLAPVDANPEALKARQEIIDRHFSDKWHRVEEPPGGDAKEEEERES